MEQNDESARITGQADLAGGQQPGRLPAAVLTLEEQAERAHRQLQRQGSDLVKNVYMEQLHDRNEVLYFKVLLASRAAARRLRPYGRGCDRTVFA